MCTVFAESEIISLLANGIEKNNVALGIIHSIGNKGVSLLNRLNIKNEVAFTGGVAKSKVLTKVIEDKIKLPIYKPNNTQIIGALGAAIIGWNMIEK